MKPLTHAILLSLLGLGQTLASSTGALHLSPLFSDGMVMQRDVAVPVWGEANPGDTISVSLGTTSATDNEFFYKSEGEYATVADANGHWTVKLSPHPAGGPYHMAITAQERSWYRITGIQFGDVWICAGQSNMSHSVQGSLNPQKEIPAAHDLKITHFEVPSIWSDRPLDEPAGGVWHEATAEHVGDFSGVGYFFARELRRSVDVPIGLILAASSNTPIEPFLSPEAMASAGMKEDAEYRSATYNGIIHPLVGYPIKGVIWYQGEQNASHNTSVTYRRRLPALIRDWRHAWGQGDFPFIVVQLPACDSKKYPFLVDSWALLREAQGSALTLPNTAQVVMIDTGFWETTHDRNKQIVGVRTAIAARKLAYGQDIEYSGPTYRRHKISHGRVTIEFDHVGHGLVAKGSATLTGFVIAGADGRFMPADAVIDQDRVVVSHAKIRHPKAVRYAWANYPEGINLYNQSGLPAAPFRTDKDWSP